MKKSIYQIAKDLNLENGTVRTWLSNYRFNKYQLIGKPLSYNVTKEMLNDLEEYLNMKIVTKKGINKKIKDTIWNLKWLRASV